MKKWPAVSLKEIAPPQWAKIRFKPDEQVWHLTLDQIDCLTCSVVNKKTAQISAADRQIRVFDEGNVLLSKIDPGLNKVLCPAEPGIGIPELVPMRPRPEFLDRYFLAFYLRSGYFSGFASASASGRFVPRLKLPKVMAHTIPLPPISEQRRIVGILGQADSLCKKRIEAETNAAKIIPALLDKMFGDQARNPKGLVKKKLGEVMTLTTGKYLSPEALEPNGNYPVYGGDGVTGRYMEFMLEDPAILISRYGRCCGKITFSESKSWISEQVMYVSEVSGEILPRYLAEVMRTANLGQYVTNSRQPLLSASRIYPIEIVIPPSEEQEKFISLALEFDKYRCDGQNSLFRLRSLFSALMARAFSGDLTAGWRLAHMTELLSEMEAQSKGVGVPLILSSLSCGT
ncbi:MAG: restriction endonuclease subunit S [Deltaproteobacteria bacterium]|nr:restriction endonuclease subunit S [Deltaproteobacteria bacterium]